MLVGLNVGVITTAAPVVTLSVDDHGPEEFEYPEIDLIAFCAATLKL